MGVGGAVLTSRTRKPTEDPASPHPRQQPYASPSPSPSAIAIVSVSASPSAIVSPSPSPSASARVRSDLRSSDQLLRGRPGLVRYLYAAQHSGDLLQAVVV